jgi:hypothetical protein
MITRVPPGTWETLPFPLSQPAGDTGYQLQVDPRLRGRSRGGRTTVAAVVSPSEVAIGKRVGMPQ